MTAGQWPWNKTSCGQKQGETLVASAHTHKSPFSSAMWWWCATPSNCGDTLKLYLPSQGGNTLDGRANSPGYGKNGRDELTMGNPQPSPKARHLIGISLSLYQALAMDAVHRLDVGGWRFESLERTNKLLGRTLLKV